MRLAVRLLCVLGMMLVLRVAVPAQDLEPRAYSASPVGTTFVVAGFGRTAGDITFDPSVPLTDVNAKFYGPVVAGGQSFNLFGRQALFTTALPYAWGNVSGNVGDQRGSVYRSGMADSKTRLSVNLRGNPAQTPREFLKREHRSFIIGASVVVSAPSGQYGNNKLINLGTNRWAFKPEVGFSWPVKKFDLDLYLATWLYTANGAFYPGTAKRTQDPLTAVQGHVSYTVRRGLWMAFDSTWYGGGSTQTNGGSSTERQANTRLGGTVSFPLSKQQSFKIAYSSGVSGTIGSKFNTISVGWQHVWFDRR